MKVLSKIVSFFVFALLALSAFAAGTPQLDMQPVSIPAPSKCGVVGGQTACTLGGGKVYLVPAVEVGAQKDLVELVLPAVGKCLQSGQLHGMFCRQGDGFIVIPTSE